METFFYDETMEQWSFGEYLVPNISTSSYLRIAKVEKNSCLYIFWQKKQVGDIWLLVFNDFLPLHHVSFGVPLREKLGNWGN